MRIFETVSNALGFGPLNVPPEVVAKLRCDTAGDGVGRACLVFSEPGIQVTYRTAVDPLNDGQTPVTENWTEWAQTWLDPDSKRLSFPIAYDDRLRVQISTDGLECTEEHVFSPRE